MSEMTKCNSCSLASMRARAARNGAEVYTKLETEGDLAGWTSVWRTDTEGAVAYFLELTEECAC